MRRFENAHSTRYFSPLHLHLGGFVQSALVGQPSILRITYSRKFSARPRLISIGKLLSPPPLVVITLVIIPSLGSFFFLFFLFSPPPVEYSSKNRAA